MAWSAPVALYCERLVPGLWGEPLNALSNIAFVAAGFAVLRMHSGLRARGAHIPTDIGALPWLILAVACCSFSFHTLATRWAGWLDSLSILLYCMLAVYTFVAHATSAGRIAAALAAVLFAAASIGTSRLLPAHTLNGSAAYLPNLLTLLAVSVYLRMRDAPAWRGFALATIVFTVALMLRTLDRTWCSMLPFGTHFLWHLLTGVLLWLVSKELTLRRFPHHEMTVTA